MTDAEKRARALPTQLTLLFNGMDPKEIAAVLAEAMQAKDLVMLVYNLFEPAGINPVLVVDAHDVISELTNEDYEVVADEKAFRQAVHDADVTIDDGFVLAVDQIVDHLKTQNLVRHKQLNELVTLEGNAS